jgi:arabinofuranosyltransferase
VGTAGDRGWILQPALFASDDYLRTTKTMTSTNEKTILAFLLLLFGYVCYTTAWLCDDAFITFRSVDHCIHGYGPVYNVGERVQAYTHPLWFGLLSLLCALTREIYYTSLLLSLLLSLGGILFFALAVAQNRLAAIVGLSILCFSKAFVEYSTSGLENPLSHALLLCFFFLYQKEEKTACTHFLLCLVACCAILTRLDFLFLYAPPLAFLFYQSQGKHWLPGFLGFLPLLVWELFSLLYYGFLYPNTAYAKLFQSGVSAWQMMAQGGGYVWTTLTVDPITVLTMAAGFTYALWGQNTRNRVLALGGLGYVAYIVSIGGDFMLGRFLSTPFLLGVLLLSHYPFMEHPTRWAGVMTVIAVLGFCSTDPPLLTGPMYSADEQTLFYTRQISNERGVYYQNTGLRTMTRKDFPFAKDDNEKRVFFVQKIGIRGYVSPRGDHLVDCYALVDPLLARLPGVGVGLDPSLRIGHIARYIPVGYYETIVTGQNHIQDAKLAKFYDKLKIITQDPIWSRERLETIWRMNTGGYTHLVDTQYYIDPPKVVVTQAQLRDTLHPAALWHDPANIQYGNNGLRIQLSQRTHAPEIQLALYYHGDMALGLFDGDTLLDTTPLRFESEKSPSLHQLTVSITNPRTVQVGYTAIELRHTAYIPWQSIHSLNFIPAVSAP